MGNNYDALRRELTQGVSYVKYYFSFFFKNIVYMKILGPSIFMILLDYLWLTYFIGDPFKNMVGEI